MTLRKSTATIESFTMASSDLSRRLGRGRTNIFLSAAALDKALRGSPCVQYAAETCLFLCVPTDGDYVRLYYQAPDLSALSDGLSDLAGALSAECEWSLPLVCDIVGKEAEAAPIAEVFLARGFAFRKKLRQLNILNARVFRHYRNSRAKYATVEDVEEVHGLLREYFDVLSDQIPNRDDLAAMVGRNEIVVVCQDGKIIAFEVFSLSGRSYHGMFSLVRKEYRTGFAYFEVNSFLRDLFDEKRVNKAILWRDESKLGTVFSTVTIGEIPVDRVDYIYLWDTGRIRPLRPERGGEAGANGC